MTSRAQQETKKVRKKESASQLLLNEANCSSFSNAPLFPREPRSDNSSKHNEAEIGPRVTSQWKLKIIAPERESRDVEQLSKCVCVCVGC